MAPHALMRCGLDWALFAQKLAAKTVDLTDLHDLHASPRSFGDMVGWKFSYGPFTRRLNQHDYRNFRFGQR